MHRGQRTMVSYWFVTVIADLSRYASLSTPYVSLRAVAPFSLSIPELSSACQQIKCPPIAANGPRAPHQDSSQCEIKRSRVPPFLILPPPTSRAKFFRVKKEIPLPSSGWEGGMVKKNMLCDDGRQKLPAL